MGNSTWKQGGKIVSLGDETFSSYSFQNTTGFKLCVSKIPGEQTWHIKV